MKVAMKALLTLTCLVISAAAWAEDKPVDKPVDEVANLKAELELQRKTSDARLAEIKKLAAEVKTAKEEIQRLQELLKKAGVDPTPPVEKVSGVAAPKELPVLTWKTLDPLINALYYKTGIHRSDALWDLKGRKVKLEGEVGTVDETGSVDISHTVNQGVVGKEHSYSVYAKFPLDIARKLDGVVVLTGTIESIDLAGNASITLKDASVAPVRKH